MKRPFYINLGLVRISDRLSTHWPDRYQPWRFEYIDESDIVVSWSEWLMVIIYGCTFVFGVLTASVGLVNLVTTLVYPSPHIQPVDILLLFSGSIVMYHYLCRMAQSIGEILLHQSKHEEL